MSGKKKLPAQTGKPPPTTRKEPGTDLVLVGADYPNTTLVQQIVRSTHMLGRPFLRLFLRWSKGQSKYMVKYEFDKKELNKGSHLIVDAMTVEILGFTRDGKYRLIGHDLFHERKMCTLYCMPQA